MSKDHYQNTSLERTPFQTLDEVREFCIQFFSTSDTFEAFSYGERQKAVARQALRVLEEEGKLVKKDEKTGTRFVRNPYSAEITPLTQGGFSVTAYRSGVSHEIFDDVKLTKPTVDIFDSESEVAISIKLLPPDMTVDDLLVLFTHLYDMRQDSVAAQDKGTDVTSGLKRFLPTLKRSHVEAIWLDEVHSRALYKFSNKNGSLFDVWQGLQPQTYDGQTWLPFGKVPDRYTAPYDRFLAEHPDAKVTGILKLRG